MKRTMFVVLALVLAAAAGNAHDPPLIQELSCGDRKCLSVCAHPSVQFDVHIEDDVIGHLDDEDIALRIIRDDSSVKFDLRSSLIFTGIGC